MGDLISTRFPEGLQMLHAALRRERIPLKEVEVKLLYYSWSWALQVKCPAIAFTSVRQLPPEALRADTAFSELCESIVEELAERYRAARPA